MNIKILHGFDQAHLANGLTVVIDVFRAFSTACYIFANGADRIIAVGDLEVARRFKTNNPELKLMGERDGKILPGFDYGNSPSKLKSKNFSNETVVLTTTTGTKGLVKSSNANEVITGSFVNVTAVSNYIKKRAPDNVSLVCCNHQQQNLIEEDEYCAKFIKQQLLSKNPNFLEVYKKIKKGVGQRFFNSDNQSFWPKEDFYLCMEKNIFNFVIKAELQSKNYALLTLN